MNRTRNISVAFSVAAGFVLFFLAAELLLRGLPAQRGIYAADPDPSWPVHRMVPNSEFRYSAGWNFGLVSTGHTNSRGYVAPFDYIPGSEAIVVLGDSYIESAMNPYEDSLQGQLPQLLPNALPVYNFGIAGSALPDYLGLAPYITRDFRPAWVVVLIGEGDFSEGYAQRPGHFVWADSPVVELVPDQERSPTTKLLRSLALTQYLRANLKLDFRGLLGRHGVPGEKPSGCTPAALEPEAGKLVDHYIERLSQAYGLPPDHIILAFDSESQRKALYGTRGDVARKSPCPSVDDLALERLRERAREAGLQVLELCPLFAAWHTSTGRRVDHSPVDWHWRREGHAIAATAIRDLMLQVDTASTHLTAPTP